MTDSMPRDPVGHAHQRRHLARLERRIGRCARMSRRYGWARLAIVVGAAGLAYMAFTQAGTNAGWAVVAGGLAAFTVAARRHDRVEQSLRRHRLWLGIQRRHLARATLDWAQLPEPPAPSAGLGVAADHPFAADLNLVGPRSLHHLLDTTASLGGAERLRAWLLAPVPDAARTAARQALVRALVPRASFRDHLTLASLEAGSDPATRWDDAPLRQWLDRTDVMPTLRPWLVGLTLFALANLVLVAGWAVGSLPPLWPFTIPVYFAIYLSRYSAFAHLFEASHALSGLLARFSPALGVLERARFRAEAPPARLLAPLRRAHRRPSDVLRRVERIAALAGLTRSELLWLLLNLMMPWELLVAAALDRTKRTLRVDLPLWLDVLYETEALAALAAYAAHHPARVFPRIDADAPPDAPVFAASALGHPLLPEAAKVRNDFALTRGDVALVTGSNMSGKSTFLRTVGINLCLAYAGAPVDAAAFRAVPLRLFTCINVADSVHDGVSYFYAEVRRLRALLDAAGIPDAPPLFALIDEIFRGTNNRERLAGGRAYVRALVDGRTAGLVSTHDLELTRLAETTPRLRNLHFREDVAGEVMTFDYTLRPGPCPTTNALRIMQRAGLPVDPVPLVEE